MVPDGDDFVAFPIKDWPQLRQAEMMLPYLATSVLQPGGSKGQIEIESLATSAWFDPQSFLEDPDTTDPECALARSSRAAGQRVACRAHNTCGITTVAA